MKLNLNTHWLYRRGDLSQAEAMKAQDFEPICLPHPNIELPHNCFTEDDYRFVSWYKRFFLADPSWQGKQISVTFGGVMTVADVYLNGVFIGQHKGGYTPFTFELSTQINWGPEGNQLLVRVDSTRQCQVPPEGHVVDYMLFGGIYREVELEVRDRLHLEDVFIKTQSLKPAQIAVRSELVNKHKKAQTAKVLFSVLDQESQIVTAFEEELEISAETNQFLTCELMIPNCQLWEPENPYLYTLLGEVEVDGEIRDQLTERFGVRTAVFAEDGTFRLNDKPIKLRGLNRHQNFPYVGGAMSARMQRQDADLLRYQLGCNIVRTSHYPQHPAFLSRCDEIGLLVFEELPGWQHIGDEAWRELSLENIREMILRDRNHPAIILWGVRVNESQDCHDFYTKTNALAKKLDPSRQTGGVRDFRKSELLEDVFTFNDFSGGIQPPIHPRYLVTEYGGHMFPTKTFDCEERLVEHALYHARVQNASYGEKIAGAIGWCAFDYNTHVDFGSGDRICYHGVMDIFRIPKYAAYFYQSQLDPKEKVVLFPATRFTQGDRSGGGLEPLVIFSNCDQIAVYINDELLCRAFPAKDEYAHLPHPPFIVEGVKWPWGEPMAQLRLEGIIAGQVVDSHTLTATGGAYQLSLKADHELLFADGSDSTRLVVAVQDVNGTVLPFGNRPVSFQVEGPGRLLGENPISPEAGRAAVFLRAGLKPGMVRVRARANGLLEASVEIEISPATEEFVKVPLGKK